MKPLSLCLLCLVLFPLTARASGTATLSGTVTDAGRPVAGIPITVAGGNLICRAVTDRVGRFSLPGLPVGTYDVRVVAGTKAAAAQVDLGIGGTSVALPLAPLREIGHVATVRASTVHGSGTDTILNANDLSKAPYGNQFSEALVQLPGAARGANGVVHMNGDHGVIDYMIDGVSIPQALNRELGSEIDPHDISFVDAIEGAYPAQYGLRFGSVLELTTKAGTGAPGSDATASYGSYGTISQTVDVHAPLRNGGGYTLGVLNEQTNRGLDPPGFDSIHNRASDTNQFLRMTLPARNGDYTDLTLTHSLRTYQIPNDVAGGEPANTDDNEWQNDAFFALSAHHQLHDGLATFGPAFKYSRIRDFGDRASDFAYTASSDCASALKSGSFGPSSCGFSLSADKTALDVILQGDEVRTFGRHEVRAGGSWDATRVTKTYAVTLQPGNFLAPILTPSTPGAATTVTDPNPNSGNTMSLYLQDNWRMSQKWEADYGLRYDYFTIRSTEFGQGFGAFSPRLKIVRSFGARANVYAYVGRFFEPFSFENVAPQAAQLLNLPLQATVVQFDLKPERDTQLEIGAHLPFGRGMLGLRVWQKNANDLIDDTQVGVTLLHQDINYALGRLSQEAATYQRPLLGGGRFYINAAHTLSLNSGCETQLLAPCFGAPAGFTPADHDQAYSVTSGILRNGAHGNWFSMDGEYGSGLSSAICPDGTPGFCKRTPHLVFAFEQGVPVGTHAGLSLRVQNLLNDRYYVTLLNAQGNHVAPGRTVNLTFSMRR